MLYSVYFSCGSGLWWLGFCGDFHDYVVSSARSSRRNEEFLPIGEVFFACFASQRIDLMFPRGSPVVLSSPVLRRKQTQRIWFIALWR